MKIDNNTKISAIVKHNNASIEAIASVAKPLEKLKNPILRRIMASRVTLAEAAMMGGCNIDQLINALKPLGYEYNPAGIHSIKTDQQEPAWINEYPHLNFDVRDLLSSGTDPLKQIMHRYSALGTGEILCIINTFAPTPLVELLKSKGADAFVRKINESEFHTFFLKRSQDKEARKEVNPLNHHTEQSFSALVEKFNGRYHAIDVRQLEMPLPMQTILKEIRQLPVDKALYVFHKKVPVYLLDELYSLNFITHINEIADGDVRLLIHHAS